MFFKFLARTWASQFLQKKRICFNNCLTIVFYYPGVVWNLSCTSLINSSELDYNGPTDNHSNRGNLYADLGIGTKAEQNVQLRYGLHIAMQIT